MSAGSILEPDAVDFVVTWVDDSDEQWRLMRDQALGSIGDTRQVREGAAAARFRDWGALRYWFRGVSEHAPWVRKIHLVTVNPLPDWLHHSHPKLNVVHHRDFIPIEYLPTFNSRVIELHLHRIRGLSENFVYFNDDMYITRSVSQEHFFPKGRPSGVGVLNTLSVGDNITHAMLNNIRIINQNFEKFSVLNANPFQWFNFKYGRGLLQNIALLPWRRFTGFHNTHLPLPLRKRTLQQVWSACSPDLELTSKSQFRQFHDVNPFLFSYWQIVTGDFSPVRPSSYGRYLQIGVDDIDEVVGAIASARTPLMCVNDGDTRDYSETAKRLQNAFQARFPNRSVFEKNDV